MQATTTSPWQIIDRYANEFEAARRSCAQTSFHSFLPAEDSPYFAQVECELLRLEMEFAAAEHKLLPLCEYLRQRTRAEGDREAVQLLAFEHYRQRREIGEEPQTDDYATQFGVDVSGWPSNTTTETAASGSGWLDAAARYWLTSGDDIPRGNIAAQVLAEVQRREPNQAKRLAAAAFSFPQPGDSFGEFALIQELGRGAFGRVFLARQTTLSERLVALKITVDEVDEAQWLARLQHPHIVPVYSVHRVGLLRGICMPFLGVSTLADVLAPQPRELPERQQQAQLVSTLRAHSQAWRVDRLRADNLSELRRVEVWAPAVEPRTSAAVRDVLRLMEQLAQGLSHAHERGIIHHDLKPANVLVTAEGNALLLDFNLAEQSALRSSVAAARVGGTLPYMSPERLALFLDEPVTVNERSDVYSLGLIGYELLSGKLPTKPEAGESERVVRQLLQSRRVAPPPLTLLSAGGSRAVQTILERCLAPDPLHRYSAAELATDLNRHLKSFPLQHAKNHSRVELARKWLARHPRWAASSAVLLVALVIAGFLAAGWWREQTKLTAVARQLSNTQAEARAQIWLNHAEGASVLRNWPAADTAMREESQRVTENLLVAYNVQSSADWRQHTDFAVLSTTTQQRIQRHVDQFTTASTPYQTIQADADATISPGEHVFASCLHALGERDLPTANAAALQLTEVEPQRLGGWFLRGQLALHSGDSRTAEACCSQCLVIAPSFDWPQLIRGLARTQLGMIDEAERDLSELLARRPDCGPAWFNRAVIQLKRGEHSQALSDLNSAAQFGIEPVRVELLRAEILLAAGDAAAAAAARARGLAAQPHDDVAWVARALARIPEDVPAALADLDKALAINPQLREALQNKAYILAELQGQNEAAIETLDCLLESYPDFVPAIGGRAVLLARMGNREAAHLAAERCLQLEPTAATRYQLAGVYAHSAEAHSDDRHTAYRLLEDALRAGYGWELLSTDPDLTILRADAEFAPWLSSLQKRFPVSGQNR